MWIINVNALSEIPLADMFELLPSICDSSALQELFGDEVLQIVFVSPPDSDHELCPEWLQITLKLCIGIKHLFV